ncbi:MAG: VRR-NUC domain-containing protein [Pseudomonadales bacterium]|nr:VRR-NUC domain-containing protein [Pseudomonadales bacterium]
MSGGAENLTVELRQQHQEALPDELPTGYYLENFAYLLGFVVDRYASLLSTEELAFRDRFLSLDEPAKKLFVRLLNRKGQFFRVDKLIYEEIPDINKALNELLDNSFVRQVTPDIEDALNLCNRTELLAHPMVSELPASTKKQLLVKRFLGAGVNPLEALEIPVVEQLNQESCAVYRLLFFGNFHQDMTEFVLHELIAPFEAYELDSDSSLFSSRAVIDSLIELKALSDLSYELMEQDASGDLLIALAEALPERSNEPILARRFDRIANRVARQLERLERQVEALQLYERSFTAPSRERQARLLEKLGRIEESLDLCEAIVTAPENEEELEFAHQFGVRHARKHGCDRQTFTKPARDMPIETIQVPRVSDRVELSALEYYRGLGFDAYYVENALMRSLFGLCFWDIIYAPVKGAFFHPFQRGPADLYSPDFVASRSRLIEDRFAELDSDLKIRVTQTLKQKYGTANQFVYWGLLDDSLLENCFSTIPGEHLCRIFRRMLADLRNNTNGLPDLILFSGNSYQLVEIKGPGDKLQKNQTRWFEFFRQENIPASVANVEYSS